MNFKEITDLQKSINDGLEILKHFDRDKAIEYIIKTKIENCEIIANEALYPIKPFEKASDYELFETVRQYVLFLSNKLKEKTNEQ